MTEDRIYTDDDRGAVRPTVERDDDRPDETTERHPAYALISASRVQGSAQLFGSDFRHRDFVTISISRADNIRSLSSDWRHSRQQVVSVALSEAQWAAFVSHMNAGEGIPCTLERVEGKSVPGILREVDRTQQFGGELDETLREAMDALDKLEKLAEAGKFNKTVVRSLLAQARNNLTPNLTYIRRQFGEHMETVKQEAKTEINAYITNRITRAGLAALKAEAPISQIDHNEGKEGTQK